MNIEESSFQTDLNNSPKYSINAKTLEQAVIHLEEMAVLGQLASGIIHEVNNPLSFLISNTIQFKSFIKHFKSILETYDTMIQAMSQDEKQACSEYIAKLEHLKKESDMEYFLEDIDEILDDNSKGLKKIKHIFDNLRSFIPDNAAEPKEMDVGRSIESVMAILSHDLKKIGVVRTSWCGSLPVFANPAELNQAFLHVFENCINTIDKKNTMSVCTLKEGGTGMVEIEYMSNGVAPVDLIDYMDPSLFYDKHACYLYLDLFAAKMIFEKYSSTISLQYKPGGIKKITVRLPLHAGED